MSSEWNVVWDRQTADRWVWDRGGGRQAGAHAWGHRTGKSNVVFFWSERVRIQPTLRRKYIYFFFLAKINFSQGKRIFSSNLIALLVMATWIEHRC